MKSEQISLALICFIALPGAAQTPKGSYPRMAPVEQYLMDRNAEIALARSAAPESISGDAEILVFTPRAFETAVKGKNGFVCMVARSWSADYDDPGFWSPKLQAPICYNALGARSQVAVTLKRTEIALAGGSPAQVMEGVKTAIASKAVPTAELGAMSYMLSRQQYLSDHDGHWRPHLMFFTPHTEPKQWGAGLAGSPVMGVEYPDEHLTVFLIPLARWSDGTPAPPDEH